MKIDCIFVEELFAMRYEGETFNELERLMNIWTDVGYLYTYAKVNEVRNKEAFVQDRLEDAEEIQNCLQQLHQKGEPYSYFFQFLEASEKCRIIPFQKGKIRRNHLRLYALKLDKNCYLITGGAIKMSQKMAEHPDTAKELEKLKLVRAFLNQNGVIDEDSFYELLIESI